VSIERAFEPRDVDVRRRDPTRSGTSTNGFRTTFLALASKVVDLSDGAVLPLSIASASATLALLAVRITSVWRDSALTQTTGGEGPGLYGIYRAWMGEPVYQSLSDNPSTMIYNFLFFRIYGGISRILASRSEQLPTIAHFFTLAVSCLLILTTLYYLKRDSDKEKRSWDSRQACALSSLMVIGILGPFTSWWTLTARPDMLAVALELLALFVFLSNGESQDYLLISVMTIAAWAAWSCKQSAIFVYAGILLCLARQRQWRFLFVSAASYCLLCVLVFAIAGRPYLEHTVIASGSLHWLASQVAAVGAQALTGAHIWLPAAALLIMFVREEHGRSANDLDLIIVLACTLLGGIATSGREGASRNYLLAAFMVCMVWIARRVLVMWTDANRARLASVPLCAAFAISLLLTTPVLVFPHSIGRAQLLTSAEREQLIARRDLVRTAPQPAFIQWAYLALPWNSNQHVTDVIDWDIYERARARGVIVSVEDRIANGFYASAVVDDPRLIESLERAGYRRIPAPMAKVAYFLHR